MNVVSKIYQKKRVKKDYNFYKLVKNVYSFGDNYFKNALIKYYYLIFKMLSIFFNIKFKTKSTILFTMISQFSVLNFWNH